MVTYKYKVQICLQLVANVLPKSYILEVYIHLKPPQHHPGVVIQIKVVYIGLDLELMANQKF